MLLDNKYSKPVYFLYRIIEKGPSKIHYICYIIKIFKNWCNYDDHKYSNKILISHLHIKTVNRINSLRKVWFFNH